jgi:hypothetical protein
MVLTLAAVILANWFEMILFVDKSLFIKDTSKSKAVILEFKTVTGNQTLQQRAEKPLAQIQARDYSAMFGQFSHIKTVLSVGMSFDDKEVICLAQ